MFFWDNKITDLTCQKTKYHPDTDKLTIHAKSPKYKYVDVITKIKVPKRLTPANYNENSDTLTVYAILTDAR